MTHLRRNRVRRWALACLACTCATLVLPGLAHASRTQVSIIQDDNLLYNGATRDGTLDEFASLGANWVHVLVRWDRIAPSPNSRSKPRFDAADPSAYGGGAWDALDAIVTGARQRGLQVLMTPSAPVPRWASDGKRSHVWKPDPRLFGQFVQALGRRYSGGFDGGSGVLPRVGRWSIWNEPNQPAWLQPQFQNGRPFAPQRYRALYRAASGALARTGHGRDLLLLGETAPLGDRGRGTRSKMRPGLFLRELFSGGHLNADGLAHHPYVKYRSQTPDSRSGDRDDFPIGATGRLLALLDREGRAGRVRRHLPVYFTEFGWQSNPPDRLFGVSPPRQAAYINESERKAYYNPRVRSMSQYLLRDDFSLASFQTGLRFANGSPKPALDAYRMPLVIIRRGNHRSLWGLIRPAPAGQPQQVQILAASKPGGPYVTVGTRRTNGAGVFTASLVTNRSYWRARWTDGSEQTYQSRVARG